MGEVIVKKWFYERIQTQALQYGRTLAWGTIYRLDDNGNEVEYFKIRVNGKTQETEKAICVDCIYHKESYGYEIDMKEYSGHRVWIPKSAIIETGGI